MKNSITQVAMPIILGAVALTIITGCAPAVMGSNSRDMVVTDRRTTGVYIEDEAIEWRAQRLLNEKLTDDKWHLNTPSFNTRLLLTGEVATDTLRAEAETAARLVNEVKDVVNELNVRPASSVIKRANDTAITGAVKARFIGSKQFAPIHVKVVTEANVVYLMGIVTQAEADAAVEVARTTRGVSKVIRVFEYR